MYKVYVTRRIPQGGLDLLTGKCELKIWAGDVPPPREVLLEEVQMVDGLLCLLTDTIDREIIEAAQRLQVIANYAVGYDNIDVAAAHNRGITVTNTPGVLTETTADLAFSLLMAAARRVVEADRFTRAGAWQAWGPLLFLGQMVHGATLGIVGMGRIGTAVAKRAKGFDMKILYFNRSAKPDVEAELGARRVELPELLSESDFVSLHAPLTPATEGLIGEQELELMKPTSILINTARGPIIDEKALVEAIKKEKIFAAALDVFEDEPVNPDSPLLDLKRVVVTPHIASASYVARTRMAQIAASNLLAVLAGEQPENPVGPPAGISE